MDKFRHIDSWVFDLDNTLYDAETHLFTEIGNRMTSYVADLLNLPHDKARDMRHIYFKRYGTTLRGLMTEHGIDPSSYLTHVHDVDISVVPPCTITKEYLSRLPGKKFVFTNAPKNFAKEMTAHLGIAHHFDGIFAIEDADYWPKPHRPTYEIFLEKHKVNPKTACMFEDMEVNLKTAHDLGMTTVHFHGKNDPQEHDHIHHTAETLATWLTHTLQKK